MFCKQCGNELLRDANNCEKCSNRVKESKINIFPNTLPKSLLMTGNSVFAIGWVTIIINISIFLWSILDSNYSESGLGEPDLVWIVFITFASGIYIILGKRIKKGADIHTKFFLEVLIGLSIILFSFSLVTGGRVGLLFILLMIYLLSSWSLIKKAMKDKEFVSSLSDTHYFFGKKEWIFYSVAALIMISVSLYIETSKRSLIDNTNISTKNQNTPFNNVIPEPNINDSNFEGIKSKNDQIIQMVNQAKSDLGYLPKQIDEITTLTDITAEGESIRYHYVLSENDSNRVTYRSMESYLKDSICSNSETRAVLDEGIGMEYSYQRADTKESLFFSFTAMDCITVD